MAQIKDIIGNMPLRISVFNTHLPHNYPQFANLLSSFPLNTTHSLYESFD